LLEIHKNLNEIDYMQRDRTHKEGSKQIDAVLTMDGILQCMKGSLIVDFNDIVISDHRGFIFDVDIKEYFNINSSKYDTNNHVRLNPTKRSHRLKFQEKLEEYIDQLNLVKVVSSKCNRSITNQELERLDEIITFVLNLARKYVKGHKRNVPYTQKKVQLRMAKQYYKGLVKQRQGVRIDQGALNKKKRMAKIGDKNLTIVELQQKVEQAEQ